ncbi:MAG: FIST C-terminal domain-containing protein [Syntrophaceae bacterium]|nr:FIST C-terminal domain-containing protein [Syntrophaceae bacterium]
MKVGIGYSNIKDSAYAGKKAAEAAISGGKIQKPGLVFAFCHHQINAEDFLQGLRSVVGPDIPILGGSAIGIITNDMISYEGCPAGVAVLQSDRLKFEIACVGELDRDERQAGQKLAESFSKKIDGNLLLIFYDSIKLSPTSSTPPIMNASHPLLRGIEEGGIPDYPVLGAGLLGDFDFSPPKIFCGSYVGSQKVVGTLFDGDYHHYYQIMHGCTPMDGIYHTITKMEGPFIYEADGRPIVQIINELYGNTEWQKQLPVRRLSIGVNYGDKYGEFNEQEYVNRLIVGILPEDKGIVMFEPDLEPETEFLFMLRDTRMMMESVRSNCLDLMNRIESNGRKAVWGLYIDCAGRTSSVSETLTEEAAEIVEIFNQRKIPLLGFYSGVEIAPMLDRSRGLDWTGVLWIITEDAANDR